MKKFFTDGGTFERTWGVQRVSSSLGHRVTNMVYTKDFGGAGRLLTDLSPYMPASAKDPLVGPWKVYYVDQTNGNDANAGTTWATALQRVPTALAKADVDVVACRGGQLYVTDATNAQGLSDYAGTRDVSIVGVGAPAVFATARALTWSPQGTPNVFQSSGTGGTIIRVVDTRQQDANGDYVALTNVASIAAVGTTPGSWFYSSSVLYVRLSDDATPDARILGLRVINQRVSADNVKVYFRNIHFIGGNGGALVLELGTATTYVTMEDCKFSHSYNSNGLSVKDVGLSIAIRCHASCNANDGFNYHEANALSPHFLEIDCTGMGNLASGDGNGSSAHEASRGLRINGHYARNNGPGIADVNTSKSWNVSVTCRDNVATSSTRGIVGIDTAELWVDGAFCEGNQGLDLEVAGNAVLHYRDLVITSNAGQPTVGSTATANQTFT